MLTSIQEKLALSEQGMKSLIKAIIWSILFNISILLPTGLAILFLLNSGILPDQGERSWPLWLYFLIILLILIIIYGVSSIQYRWLYIATYDESAERRVRLAENIRRLPLAYFGKKDLSDITSTLMSDCAALETFFSHAAPQLAAAVVSSLLISLSMFWLDWRMALALLWVIPVALMVIIASRGLQLRGNKKQHQAMLESTDGIQECLDNILEIKSYNYEEIYLDRLEKKFAAHEKAQQRSEWITGSMINLAHLILKLGLVSVLYFGIRYYLEGSLDLTSLLMFLIASSLIYDPLALAFAFTAHFFIVEEPLHRMREVEKQVQAFGQEEFSPKSFDIVFKDVSFSYADKEDVLHKLSFTAKQGEVTALIGPSGSGKSTVAKLAARFWDIDSGQITLGGEDISTINNESLLRYFSIVFQDVVLFDDSVLANIRIGRKDATDEEVLAAAKTACCDEFVQKLPDGYNTQIGENGKMLSGGERQRISIARAILKDAPIILLDEATASLDTENESEIQTALSQLIQNKTVLIIAHRMRTVSNANRLIVLENGRIVETGTPQELLQQKGLYAHMLEIQNRSADWQPTTDNKGP